MEMQIVQIVFVIVNENPMGKRFWTGVGNKWSEERPDAQEYATWREANNAVELLFEAYPTSPAAQRATIVEETQEPA